MRAMNIVTVEGVNLVVVLLLFPYPSADTYEAMFVRNIIGQFEFMEGH